MTIHLVKLALDSVVQNLQVKEIDPKAQSKIDNFIAELDRVETNSERVALFDVAIKHEPGQQVVFGIRCVSGYTFSRMLSFDLK